MDDKGRRISEYSIAEILSEDPFRLLELLREEYDYEIPEIIDSIDDLRKAGFLIGRLANTYSYMAQLSSYAKIAVRNAKKEKRSKNEIDDAIDRKSVIDTFTSTIEMKYKAVSRLLTIKQQINEELKMTDGR